MMASVPRRLGLALGAAAPAYAASDIIHVDFSQSTGDFRGGATGTLYGFGDEGAPTDALINGAHLTNISQKAPYGAQHPSGDALKVEDGFFDNGGEYIMTTSRTTTPTGPTTAAARPDRTYNTDLVHRPNGVWDLPRGSSSSSPRRRDAPAQKYIFIPFNEPDGATGTELGRPLKETFLADWKAAYRDDQGGLPPTASNAAGPGDAVAAAARARPTS